MTCEDYDESNGPGIVEKVAFLIAPLLASRPTRAMARLLPQGVKKVMLRGDAGVITAFANIDFDEIRAGQHSSNPLLTLFSGRHDVRVEAKADASNGEGHVHVRDVSLDGVEIPPVALQFFVNKYIAPKYPNIGIDSAFHLRDKVDTATVGYHKLTVTQR